MRRDESLPASKIEPRIPDSPSRNLVCIENDVFRLQKTEGKGLVTLHCLDGNGS